MDKEELFDFIIFIFVTLGLTQLVDIIIWLFEHIRVV
jgi:predicted membrane protein